MTDGTVTVSIVGCSKFDAHFRGVDSINISLKSFSSYMKSASQVNGTVFSMFQVSLINSPVKDKNLFCNN